MMRGGGEEEVTKADQRSRPCLVGDDLGREEAIASWEERGDEEG